MNRVHKNGVEHLYQANTPRLHQTVNTYTELGKYTKDMTIRCKKTKKLTKWNRISTLELIGSALLGGS